MEPRSREATRPRSQQGEVPNWIFIAGSALLSALSIRLGYKLKQVFYAKEKGNSSENSKVNRKAPDVKTPGNSNVHSNTFTFRRNEDGYFTCCNGRRNVAEVAEMALPLVTLPTSEFSRDGVMFSSSPDCLEPPQKPFNQSNCSDSVSESGSDIFTRREVIQKLRQQLKRRDDMILEMQDRIAQLQNTLTTEIANSSHLQSLVDAANRDLFNSESEVQKLRKAIADHCVGYTNPGGSPHTGSPWAVEQINGHHANGYTDAESNFSSSQRVKEVERVEMLKREVRELKDLIEGKDYLLQSYKEQKSELSMKIKELQQRLDSQLPNIL